MPPYFSEITGLLATLFIMASGVALMVGWKGLPARLLLAGVMLAAFSALGAPPAE